MRVSGRWPRPISGAGNSLHHVDGLIIDQIPHLRRYARALTGDPARADDLVQDCLERAWSRLHQWRHRKHIRGWLFTILHNLYVNTVKRQASGPNLVSVDNLENLRAVRGNQDGVLELRELDHALRKLSPADRGIILLVGLEQLSYRETAEILGVPVGTVMSRLSRAREKLRASLAETPAPKLGKG